VRLGEPGYPPITGFLVSVAGRKSYLPAERLADLTPRGVLLFDLARFERRPEEVRLKHDVLDHQLINVDDARLVRVNEIELARVEGWWRVVGVDTGPRGGVRRLLPRPLGRRVAAGTFLDWASIKPFVGHVPSLRLVRLRRDGARPLRPDRVAPDFGGTASPPRPQIAQARAMTGCPSSRCRRRHAKASRTLTAAARPIAATVMEAAQRAVGSRAASWG
jgi:hypothetical protein